MARTIWKYELEITDLQKVLMPRGAALLHVGVQGSNEGRDRSAMLWASVDPGARPIGRLIAIVGTGNPAPEPDEAIHVGSFFDGPFVWHVFDAGEWDV